MSGGGNDEDGSMTKLEKALKREISINGDSTVAATGHTCHAATTPEGRPCRLPERVREVFA